MGEFVQLDRLRQRSMGFLEQGEESWSCTLVTYQDEASWRGFFSFRPRQGEDEEGEEIRTADIFIEESESQIDRKARDLGRPLLLGLLASALHLRARSGKPPPRLRGWFQTMLQNNSRELSGAWEKEESETGERSVAELQSMYASYRLDQVAHPRLVQGAEAQRVEGGHRPGSHGEDVPQDAADTGGRSLVGLDE
jgi:hypothetical protein